VNEIVEMFGKNESYDIPYEYGIGLDGVVPIVFSEAKVRPDFGS